MVEVEGNENEQLKIANSPSQIHSGKKKAAREA
jgi:hypothetical protein